MTLLVRDHPTWEVGLLLALVIWCFCRFYFFALYAIKKYVDPGYKFSGLWSFASHLRQLRKNNWLGRSAPAFWLG